MRLVDLRRINRRAIHLAGPRYLPGQDRDAPNLQITAITEIFDALGITAQFRAAVQESRSRVREEWRHSPADFRASLGRLVNSPERLLTDLNALSEASPRDAGAAAGAVKQCARAVNSAVQRRLKQLDAALNSAAPNPEAYRALESDAHRVRRFMTAVRSVVAFTETPSFQVMATNRLSMLGRWGTGKTHSLCDITERRMSQRLPTVLCLGQQLPDGVDPSRASAA